MDRIQVIKCKCGEIFAMCIEPECYIDKEWVDELRYYVASGCTVDLVKQAAFGKCTCEKKIRHPKSKAEGYNTCDFSTDDLIEELEERSPDLTPEQVQDIIDALGDISCFNGTGIAPATGWDQQKLDFFRENFDKITLDKLEAIV